MNAFSNSLGINWKNFGLDKRLDGVATKNGGNQRDHKRRQRRLQEIEQLLENESIEEALRKLEDIFGPAPFGLLDSPRWSCAPFSFWMAKDSKFPLIASTFGLKRLLLRVSRTEKESLLARRGLTEDPDRYRKRLQEAPPSRLLGTRTVDWLLRLDNESLKKQVRQSLQEIQPSELIGLMYFAEMWFSRIRVNFSDPDNVGSFNGIFEPVEGKILPMKHFFRLLQLFGGWSTKRELDEYYSGRRGVSISTQATERKKLCGNRKKVRRFRILSDRYIGNLPERAAPAAPFLAMQLAICLTVHRCDWNFAEKETEVNGFDREVVYHDIRDLISGI